MTIQRVGEFARSFGVTRDLAGDFLYHRPKLRVEFAPCGLVSGAAPDRECQVFYMQRHHKSADDGAIPNLSGTREAAFDRVVKRFAKFRPRDFPSRSAAAAIQSRCTIASRSPLDSGGDIAGCPHLLPCTASPQVP